MRRIYAPMRFGSFWWPGQWGCRGTPRADAAGLPASRCAGSDWAPPHERGGERGGGPVLAKLDKGFDDEHHEVGLLGAWGLYMYVSWPRDVHCPSSDRGCWTAAIGPRPTMPVHRYCPPMATEQLRSQRGSRGGTEQRI